MTSKNGHVPLPFPYGSLDRGIRTAVRTLFEKSRLLNPARVEAGHALTAHDEMSANLYCVGRTARGRTGPQSRLLASSSISAWVLWHAISLLDRSPSRKRGLTSEGHSLLLPL